MYYTLKSIQTDISLHMESLGLLLPGAISTLLSHTASACRFRLSRACANTMTGRSNNPWATIR